MTTSPLHQKGKLLKNILNAIKNSRTTVDNFTKKISASADMVSKKHPNYFKKGRTFSDIKKDGSLRMDPLKSNNKLNVPTNPPIIVNKPGAITNAKTTKVNAKKMLDVQKAGGDIKPKPSRTKEWFYNINS